MTSDSNSTPSRQLVLPPSPASETGAVKAWREPVEMVTYLPDAADVHPMFLDKRVYQGSSGKVYPLPVIDRIATDPVMHRWDALHIENEYLRVMVLPEIGGRIHVGYDKTNGYDFFYRQNVIKPALVGLAGSWASGGVEFNWPQHHRPDTFKPTTTEIERGDDGSVTIWCSQQDSLSHMKGMHGVCLHPGKAILELKVRLYNRTESVQTFLWWANAAARVHEQYQSFFPPDVRYVADHARRAVTSYPRSDRKYYGVDYPDRAKNGVPADEQPSQFQPDGSYPPDDLGWYANIPVPTSYMITSTKGDFLGGYDHKARAGVLHIANHHIAPGKKQWTWGNHEFGYSWDRSLTDNDGPYIELMAGVYTDNQPDFSYLAPGETRIFTQYWYPIRAIGVPQAANLRAALSLQRTADGAQIGVCVTEDAEVRVVLSVRGEEAAAWESQVSIAKPAQFEYDLPSDISADDLSVRLEIDAEVVLQYATAAVEPAPSPEAATEPPQPPDVASNDELYLIGVHLRQYRHATRAPEPYWQEALSRDPGDSRCHTAMGISHLQRGELHLAEEHLRAAIKRLTARNANPADGEAFYHLGLVLRHQRRFDEAYAAFYKATWNAAWRGAAFYALAEIDARKESWSSVLELTEKALQAEGQHMNARSLRVVALREKGELAAAEALLFENRRIDPLDNWTIFLASGAPPENGQDRLDLAFDLRRAGLLHEALTLLSKPYNPVQNDGARPMLQFALAATLAEMEEVKKSEAAYDQACNAPPQYCFPNRLEEMDLLQEAMALHPEDARVAHFLGTMYYDRQRYEEAISLWEKVPAADICNSIAQRNLGIAYFNVRHDRDAAIAAYEQAFTANPASARLLYERDQLWKRTGETPEKRLDELLRHPALTVRRDDLSVELATLLNETGQPERALDVLQREFQPWEGGEGLVLEQYVRAHRMLAQLALSAGSPTEALRHLETALDPPRHLGETFHLLANRSEIFYWLGQTHAALGEQNGARHFWELAASKVSDFQQMAVNEISSKTYWSAKSLEALGKTDEARALFQRIAEYADKLQTTEATVDYFATSLPTLLLFHEDLQQRNIETALLLRAQANKGLGAAFEAIV